MAKRSGRSGKGKGGGLPRFDIARLRQSVGETMFARGAAYHEQGQVEIVGIERGWVRARVQGSVLYRTELAMDSAFTGSCTCPAYEKWQFCKHLVATALAANEVKPQELAGISDQRDRIRVHLQGKGVDGLIDMIMHLADRDSDLLRSLELATAADEPDEKVLLARLKKAIDQATNTEYGIDYRAVRGWARGIDEVLEQIEPLIERGRATIVLQLMDHFFDRIDAAYEGIDDSDGQVGGTVARALEIHHAACRKAKPDRVQFARGLFARELGSDSGYFGALYKDYVDVLGKTGLAEYRRLAEEAWQEIKPVRDAKDARHVQSGDRSMLKAILEWFAERDGDLDTRIALRTKDLSSFHAYLDLASLCLGHGRKAEALKWLEDGLWLFDKDLVHHLPMHAADLYRRLGRETDAERLLWQAFERSPDMQLYEALKKCAAGESAAGVAERAIEALNSRIASADRQPFTEWSWPSPADLLCQVLMAEARLSDAWAAARSHGCREDTLDSLAKASEEELPSEALDAYARLAEQHLAHTMRSGYEAACRIIERMRSIRERLGQSAGHAAWVEDLAARHKAKRNFIKLLRAPSREGSRPRADRNG